MSESKISVVQPIGYKIRGHSVDFHIYVNVRDSDRKVAALKPYFDALPDEHLKVLCPIFVMKQKPAGGPGGGTWRSGEVLSQVMGDRKSAKTGVADAAVKQYVVDMSKGMIGIPQDRWERDTSKLCFTVMHEVAHCVDFRLGLVAQSATEKDFDGMLTNKCGAGSPMARRAVEAYARWICRPGKIFHTDVPPTGETVAQANKRLQDALRRSPAFKSVKADWQPVLTKA